MKINVNMTKFSLVAFCKFWHHSLCHHVFRWSTQHGQCKKNFTFAKNSHKMNTVKTASIWSSHCIGMWQNNFWPKKSPKHKDKSVDTLNLFINKIVLTLEFWESFKANNNARQHPTLSAELSVFALLYQSNNICLLVDIWNI